METRKKLATVTAACLGLGTMVLGGSLVKPASAQVGLSPTVFGQRHRAERHPEIRRALRNLQQAQRNLQQAQHDFGGHREQALDLTQRAIDQCQQALRDDRH